MALNPWDITNFETLKRAFAAGDVVLVECKDARTGDYRAVIAAVVQLESGEYEISPFGHLAPENPYEHYMDPLTAMDRDAHVGVPHG